MISAKSIRRIRASITAETSTSYIESGKLPIAELLELQDELLAYLQEKADKQEKEIERSRKG